jgi:hypothetical protein
MLLDKDEPLNNEYKFYCGSGDIAFTFVRQPGADGRLLEGVLDAQGKVRAGGFDSGELSADVSKPPEWDALVATALALSQEFDFVRCDLYAINGEVYFSELTLYTLGGLAWVDDSELNERYTRLWDLRQSWFMRTHNGAGGGFMSRHLTGCCNNFQAAGTSMRVCHQRLDDARRCSSAFA